VSRVPQSNENQLPAKKRYEPTTVAGCGSAPSPGGASFGDVLLELGERTEASEWIRIVVDLGDIDEGPIGWTQRGVAHAPWVGGSELGEDGLAQPLVPLGSICLRTVSDGAGAPEGPLRCRTSALETPAEPQRRQQTPPWLVGLFLDSVDIGRALPVSVWDM
jgi:hypothetical protein